MYYWPQMRKDVKKFVRACKICQSNKHINQKPYGLMGRARTVSFPFQCIALDIMGPFPKSVKGNTYLLVVMDQFSKYTFLKPLSKVTTQAIVNFLENEVFLKFGTPQFVIADNATYFANDRFKRFCDEYKVHKILYNARYHPQINPVERVNKTIGTAIRSFIPGNDHRYWDKEIGKLSYAICTAIHEATGYAPAFLNFGRYIPNTGDFYGKISGNNVPQFSKDQCSLYSKNFEDLSEVYRKVQHRLSVACERNRKYYNLRRQDKEFSLGDKVWKKNRVQSDGKNRFSAKLAPRYIPCVIAQKISRLVYELRDENGVSLGRFHIKDLKPRDDLLSDSDVSNSSDEGDD